MTTEEIDELVEEWRDTCQTMEIPFTMADALEFAAQASDPIAPRETPLP